MAEYNIYQDIAQRSGGDVYIGVVGPVRTGKSTFIKRFMDTLVIPNIENEYQRERAKDELPQSSAGKTIMTTEPKFIPEEAVSVNLGDNASLKVRMIDCVGYVVNNSVGYFEENGPRMVSTPWQDYPIPFEKAAEIGTKKVICEHSNIGLVVTTDGSVCEIDREDYIEAEERVISELKEINKPFVILLNSRYPQSDNALYLKNELENKYQVPVMLVNCEELSASNIKDIIENILFEFPLTEVCIKVPDWMKSISKEHWLSMSIYETLKTTLSDIYKINDVRLLVDSMKKCEYIKESKIYGMDLGKGNVDICIEMNDELYYKILTEITGLEINSDENLIKTIKKLANMKKEYDKIAPALKDVWEKGYGIVTPSIEELSLNQPQIVKQGGKFGVKLKASAPSVHLIKADIETEVCPIVGSEKQSEELAEYLMSGFENDPSKIWDSNIFGKSLYELVNEGLHTKLLKMPDESRAKLQNTLERIINEGSGGLICIIL